jgi:hypothetical protein
MAHDPRRAGQQHPDLCRARAGVGEGDALRRSDTPSRSRPAAFEDAIRQASIYQAAFLTPPTTDAIINAACELARVHRLQLWDCVVCAAAVRAGAKALLTEDLQDGSILDGLRLINPFLASNAGAIDALLAA